ncbi:protein phosphatase 2C-like domain-containing protein 1 isoform X2 [Camelus ferus]|uniref:Protein phosphatase 2C-like domain-containing protein 1 isoform X2 n=2 Tax=Camelus TaxID=9836 RepID=A0A8B8TRX0_CAMFR|nr:protein phosphatase 2C-like domain-containing protein 1 isoform X2 [Camelus ferus]XP_045376015.1 protein phosphatase 2C-like domain-containing protein 1 isoform X2 [Camelus bactrianus]
MDINNAFRMFWKPRQLTMRKPTSDSDEEVPLSWRRKYFRKKRRPSKDSENHKDQDNTQTVTFPCSICNHEIDLPRIFFHKKQHVALAMLGFQWMGGKKPGLSVIATQRQSIIAKLLSSSAFTEKTLQSINSAFELLRKKQIPSYYKIIDNIPKSSTYSQKICHLLIKGVAICEDRNSMWRVDMNDKFTIVNNFGNKPNVCFFGLFDGHHGASAADLTSVEFPVLLLHQLSTLDPSYQMTSDEQSIIDSFHTVFREDYTAVEDLFSRKRKTRELKGEYEKIHKAFAKVFWRMDRLLRLGRKEASRVRWSGCSAVTCLLEGNVKNPYAERSWRRMGGHDGLADRFPSQEMPQVISGVLHIANTGLTSSGSLRVFPFRTSCSSGITQCVFSSDWLLSLSTFWRFCHVVTCNVQAVLCRNGKGFCLTKEHTMQNINERRRVLQNGAVSSSNEPYGLVEEQIKTTRGLGFHGNPKLKKFIIPAPQTISVPIDDLCQFLILATNGLWEVLDIKEATALTMTAFHVYTETRSTTGNKLSTSTGPLLSPINEQNASKSETNIHIVFQSKSEFEECVSTTNSKERSDSKDSEHFTCNPGPCSEKETDEPTSMDSVPKDASDKEKKSYHKSFYEGAAEYISRELVNAALAAGSRDNITVMVILLSGSEYQFQM